MNKIEDYQICVKADVMETIQKNFDNLNAMFDDIKNNGKKNVEVDGIVDTYRKELDNIAAFVKETQETINQLNCNIKEVYNEALDNGKKANSYFGWFTQEQEKCAKALDKLKVVRDTLNLLIG